MERSDLRPVPEVERIVLGWEYTDIPETVTVPVTSNRPVRARAENKGCCYGPVY